MSDSPYRTLDDIDRAVRAVSRTFNADKVFIIGSQAILLTWPNSPTDLRTTPEIDVYPANASQWEQQGLVRDPDVPPEASEEINALFGIGSAFHEKFGFYIDGVDEHTATLPDDWQSRAVTRNVDVDGRAVIAVAPSPDDLIVSKLARLDDKDKTFIETYHSVRPLNPGRILELIERSGFDRAIADRAIAYIETLVR